LLSSDDPSMWTVYAGDVDLEGNGQIYNVSFILIHEDRCDPYMNDIALLKVSIRIYGRHNLIIPLKILI
jgi:hypothetical protein